MSSESEVIMTELEFNELEKTHDVLASGWSSANMSSVTVIGNKAGTPIAIRYVSGETDGEFRYINLNSQINSERNT